MDPRYVSVRELLPLCANEMNLHEVFLPKKRQDALCNVSQKDVKEAMHRMLMQ